MYRTVLLCTLFGTHTGLISAAASTDADDSLIVLLNPQWLAKIMTEVIELEPGNKGYDQKAMKTLKTEGTVERCVLKKCWEELCDIDEMFDKICKILEIYYLLCPIDKPPSKYLVPTKLPDCGDVKFTKKCTEFFFEFPLYLPVEVYTHLVCVFLKSSNDKSHYELTSTSSSFCPVLDINWKVSLEANRQRLKIQTRFVDDVYSGLTQLPYTCHLMILIIYIAVMMS